MRKESLQFLRDLIAAPSPSGFEQPAQRVVRSYIEPVADEVRVDLHGNLIAVKNPSGVPRVMLAGHVDQVGMMVMHITEEGCLRVQSIGGLDEGNLLGARVWVHTKAGPLAGVIGRTAVHILPSDQRRRVPEIHELWVDIGAKDKKAAEELVRIGDPVTYQDGWLPLQQDLVAAAGFDDKVGAFVVMEALRLAAAKKLSCALYAVSTVQEELGLRGAHTSAFGIDPKIGIAVDVTHATDYPGAPKDRQGDIKVGAGPVIERGANINPVLFELLVSTAEKQRLPYQLAGAPRATGTDANAIQLTRAGVAAALISIPNRYMHSPVEVISLRDLENAARLLAAVVAAIDERLDLTPR
jgi:putative aminopeptidase FrvX